MPKPDGRSDVDNPEPSPDLSLREEVTHSLHCRSSFSASMHEVAITHEGLYVSRETTTGEGVQLLVVLKNVDRATDDRSVPGAGVRSPRSAENSRCEEKQGLSYRLDTDP